MRLLQETYNTMTQTGMQQAPAVRGIVLRGSAASQREGTRRALLEHLGANDLLPLVQAETGQDVQGPWVRVWLAPTATQDWAPGFDTMALAQRLGIRPLEHSGDLQREILTAMLMAPTGFEFPSLDELESAIHIRRNIVQAASRTTLAFDTEAAERPEDCWTYDEDKGFTLLPGVPLIDALIKTTQPEVSGRLYSFSILTRP